MAKKNTNFNNCCWNEDEIANAKSGAGNQRSLQANIFTFQLTESHKQRAVAVVIAVVIVLGDLLRTFVWKDLWDEL